MTNVPIRKDIFIMKNVFLNDMGEADVLRNPSYVMDIDVFLPIFCVV